MFKFKITYIIIIIFALASCSKKSDNISNNKTDDKTTKDSNNKEIPKIEDGYFRVYYHRTNMDYDSWGIWAWDDFDTATQDSQEWPVGAYDKTGDFGDYVYFDLNDDNKTNPLDGTGTDPKTWDGGYTKKEMQDLTSCRNPDQVIQQCLADACEKVCDNDPIMNLDDIKELCKGEKISVGDWRKHNGFLHVSCTDIESSIPFPDSRDWEGPFDVLDVLNSSLKPCSSPTLPLDLPVWENCSDGDFCVTAYPMGACVWSFDDEAEKYKIFTSIKSDNQDRPFEGSKMTEPSWDGGYTICEYLNRPVSKNLNNELASPETSNCYIGCDEINPDSLEIKKIGDKLVLSVKTSKGLKQTSSGIEAKIGDGLEFGSDGEIKVGQIGVDINGNPVNAGACLMTCSTDRFISGIDDQGLITTLTLSDGQVITGTESPDIRISSFAIVNDIITLKLSDGSELSETIAHPDDVKLQGAVVDPVTEKITYTLTDGSEIVEDHPNRSPTKVATTKGGVDLVQSGTIPCVIGCEDINTDQLEFVGGKLSIKPSWLCAEIAKCIKALPTC